VAGDVGFPSSMQLISKKNNTALKLQRAVCKVSAPLLLLLVLTAFSVVNLHSAFAAASFRVTDVMLDTVEKQYGEFARRRVAGWGQILETGGALPVQARLKRVNDFFNQMMFVSDLDNWGIEDYWATPLELLERQAGDCEDFALAKYFTLRELGVPADKLRLTYAKSLTLNQAHMVLTFYKTPTAEPLILDNLEPDIKPASSRNDLEPVYSFNGEGLWLAKQRGLGRLVGGSERISLWLRLTKRMDAEGLNLKR